MMTKPTGKLLFAYNTIASLNEHITELQVRLSNAETMSGKEQSIRDLEQQAKALSQYSEQLISDAEVIPLGLEHKGRGSNIYNWQTHFGRELRYRANKLSNAKEALKEQDNG